MKHQDVIERFRKAYREAYTGILRPEVLEGGNKWFEDFIIAELDRQSEEIIELTMSDEIIQLLKDWKELAEYEIPDYLFEDVQALVLRAMYMAIDSEEERQNKQTKNV